MLSVFENIISSEGKNSKEIQNRCNKTYQILGEMTRIFKNKNVNIDTKVALYDGDLAAGAFNKLRNIWKSNTLRNITKLRLFNSNIISILTYECESWKATKATDKRLNTFENKCLRIILNVK